MRPETKLARVFTDLAEDSKKLDSVAAGILAIVAEAKVRTAEQFNPLVSAAYEANGWNPRPGRPTAEAKGRQDVPGTVRTYVTAVRRALRRNINVSACRTFYELRKKIRETKVRQSLGSAPRGLTEEAKNNIRGVNFEAPDDFNGAFVHDLGVVYTRLPRELQVAFERELRPVLYKYLPRTAGIKTLEQEVTATVKEVELAA